MANTATPARHDGADGFTLIEIMVVIVILGILATLIIPRIMDRPDQARRTKASLDIQAIGQALDLYRLDNHRYPTTDQGLDALVKKPTVEPIPKQWRQNGYLAKLPKDPWEGNYVYMSPGNHGEYDLVSMGADAELGGEGNAADIESWNLSAAQ
ncbi:MAG: type II secretion system major pseudopilin GspG [Nitrospirae bacterium]|nr:type II secretion system major pseudopilin GspG [Magnetococcales bacterium]HAT48885.1 type II secretion system protein GspG [Alphaproteobacteria bacterium]